MPHSRHVEAPTTSQPIQRILVPVDFSPTSRNAAAYAAQIAKALGARVTLLHVWSGPKVSRDLSDWWDGLRPEERSASLASYITAEQQGPLNELAVMVRQAGVREVSTQMLEGVPEAVVLEQAESFDLVVMGSHGRSGVIGFLVGSMPERVARRCTVPVLVVPYDDDQPTTRNAPASSETTTGSSP